MKTPFWMRWRGLKPPDESRWVILDVETTGLTPSTDDLLCISALALHRDGSSWQLVPADSFEIIIKPAVIRSTPDNVLIHRIGWGEQSRGVELEGALKALSTWVAHSPVLAFHAAFDRAFLMQAHARQRMTMPGWSWLDLADILAVAFADAKAKSLDEWIAHTGVTCVRRHQAAADVWASAQLWLMASSRIAGAKTLLWRDLQACSKHARWLGHAMQSQ